MNQNFFWPGLAPRCRGAFWAFNLDDELKFFLLLS
jgi:hypothetical protein